MTCTEEYYPPWSARGIRPVRCTRPAKKMLYVPSDGKHRPVCGIHARMYREYGGDYVLEELEGDTRMKTAEVIMWLEQYLYLNAGASSKAAAKNAALAIVNQLIDKGVLVVSDATPSKRETA